MQDIECDRITSLEQLIQKFTIQLNLMSKKMLKVAEVFENIHVDINQSLKTACKKYGTGPNEQEIYLYDFYSENTKNMMNKERRIANLSKWAGLLQSDVQFQLKSKQGLEKVKNFAKENPNFNTNNDAEVNLKLESVNLMQVLYEASLFKVKTALFESSDSTSNNVIAIPTYQYSNFMNTRYDKQVNIIYR